MESFGGTNGAFMSNADMADVRMAPHPNLPRGKRRGDRSSDTYTDETLLSEEFPGLDRGGSGDCVGFKEAKRQCLGLSHPSFPKCNADPVSLGNGHLHHQHPAAFSNGHLHSQQHPVAHTNGHLKGHLNGHLDSQHPAALGNGHHQGQCPLESPLSTEPESDMDTSGKGIQWPNSGFHDSQRDKHHDHQGGNEVFALPPTMSNGYYGYIAHYEHLGREHHDASMDVQTNYGPQARRVCARCSAGESGHITHIIGE